MPKKKKGDVKADEKVPFGIADRKTSIDMSKSAKNRSKNVNVASKDSVCTQLEPNSHARIIVADAEKNSRKRRSKTKQQSCLEGAALEDESSSGYFATSQESKSSVRGEKRKLKKENSTSYAAKIKTMRDEVHKKSAEGSDAEFETVPTNCRSSASENYKSCRNWSEEKLANKRGKLSKGNGCEVGTRNSKTEDILLDDKTKNAKNASKNSRKEGEKQNMCPSNKKRKSIVSVEAPDVDYGLKIKKPKKHLCEDSLKIKRVSGKGISVTREKKSKKSEPVSGKGNSVARGKKSKTSEPVKNVNNNKCVKSEKDKTKDVLNILQKTEGIRLEEKVGSKETEHKSEDSSDEESMMDVDEDGMMDVNESPVSNADIATVTRPLSKSVDHTDAMAVLMHMEGPSQMSVVPSASRDTSCVAKTMSDDGTSDEESDWEDVEDHHGSPKKSQLPSGPVEITLDAPVVNKKRKKGEFDLQAYFKRQINKFKREVAMDIHKVHLLCLLSRCQYLNSLCKDETVQAQALSLVLVTKELKLPPVKSCMECHVTQVLTWIQEKKCFLTEVMAGGLTELSAQLKITLICVILLRQVGFLTRLVMSLQPVPFKEISTKKGKSAKSSKISKGKTSQRNQVTNSKKDTKQNIRNTSKKSKVKIEKVNKLEAADDLREDAVVEQKELKQDTPLSKRRQSDRKCSNVSEKTKNKFKDNYAEDSEDAEEIDISDDDEEWNEAADGRKKKSKKKSSRRNKTDVKSPVKDEDISDDDFEQDSILIQTRQLRKESPSRKNKRVLSSDDESTNMAGVDNWAEVYLQKEKKWICIDCVQLRVKKPYEIENEATQPVCYIVGITQEDYMRDVTARYASQWLTDTRKLRVDSDWWEGALQPYICPDKQRNKMEDEELNSRLHQQPLPTSVSAFKGHPLYALRRHLLKFEALYPESAIPVGYIKGEPVYARECVHTLHSRENWLKEGRAVRIGEEAYKFVKSRAKWNRPKEDPEAKDLELFGRWQTEQYIPPPAVDGKVPRNAHGNVEMFLPSMLPAGTVHLKIAGLNKVAKKLDIDCAPAMVGWDHHCGFSHPLMDGWIVCEEHKDILLAAWDEEQEIIKEKEQQKREKRVYDNWRKLIRGMLIKERIKKRFDLEEKGDK